MSDQNADFMSRARARGEAKNQEARDALQPLEPGERPLAVTIGSVVAMLLAIVNIVNFLTASGAHGGGELMQTILLCVVLVAASVGMWFGRYWAVLGFQTVLALQMIIFGLTMMVAESVAVILLYASLTAAFGVLFWFLIRAMARIQMPEGPERRALRERLAEIEAEQADEPGAPITDQGKEDD